MQDTTIFDRFRCKSCDGSGRHDDIPCTPCQGQGYTIPHEQRQLWSALVRAIDLRLVRIRATMMKEAEQQFNKYFPPENPLCQAHPNVLSAIAPSATTSMDSSSRIGRTQRSVTSAISGWLKWPKVMRLSRKTIITGEPDLKS